VHPVQIGQWRKTALEQLAELFVDGRSRKRMDHDAEKDALYEQIGRLKVELDWLKKKARQKKSWVDSGSGSLPSEW
jgi:transposase